MFSFFSKKQPPKSKDFIWISKKAKFNALMKALIQNKSTEVMFIISHFEETKTEISDFMRKAQLVFKEMEYLSEYQSNVPLYLVPANAFFSSPDYRLLGDKLTGQRVIIFVLEHYPLKKTDELLHAKILGQFPASPIAYYLSLEDDFFAQIGNERLIQLMSQMGLKEDEMIEHALISESIARYQAKVEKAVKTERKAASMKEWFRFNTVQ